MNSRRGQSERIRDHVGAGFGLGDGRQRFRNLLRVETGGKKRRPVPMQNLEGGRPGRAVIENRHTAADISNHLGGDAVASEILMLGPERHWHIKKIRLLQIALDLGFIGKWQDFDLV